MDIKEIIKRHGFRSGRALALAIGVPERTVQRWTAGTRENNDWIFQLVDDSLLLHELLEGKKTLADIHREVAKRELISADEKEN